MPPPMLYSPPDNTMSSLLSDIPTLSISNLLHILGVVVAAILINRILRVFTNQIVKPAPAQTRAAQAREQQTRTLADVTYSAASKVVWVLAGLIVAQEFGINVTPVVILAGLAALAVGFGAQNLVRDVISGFYIVVEDQFTVGDTIQAAETIGRVEHLTLRRTVVRDGRGALVTLSNAGLCGRRHFATGSAGARVAGAGRGSDGVAQRCFVVSGVGRWAADTWLAVLRPDGVHGAAAGSHRAGTP
jgi:mechanosensitive ion channel-like protein